MSLGSPSTFDFCDDRPEATLDPEWRALVRQQAHTLAAMLHRLQTAVAGVHRCTNARQHHAAWLQALAAQAEQFLAAQAQQHVSLERELGQLQACVIDVRQAPAALTQRVQRLERALEVLHANLVGARHRIAALLQEEPLS